MTPKEKLIEATEALCELNTNELPENKEWEHGYLSATADFLKLIEEILP